MKKLLLGLAVCAFSFSNAQKKVTFGAKAGSNLATFTGDFEENDMKVGFHVGGLAEISINDKFSVQPELLFSTQGTQFSSDDKINLSYINLPVIAKYYATDGLSIEAGPQVGFLVNAEQEVEGESSDFDNTNDIDFGLNFGLGYKLDSGINFSARYNLGLSNIIDTDSNFEAKNSVFQFSVGYFFN
jgi:hypothetical protein